MAISQMQEQLATLLTSPDFRGLLIAWMEEAGATPYSGVVTPESAAEVSFMNGRASWVTQLMDEIRETFPDHYETIERERRDARTRMAAEFRRADDDARRSRAIRIGYED